MRLLRIKIAYLADKEMKIDALHQVRYFDQRVAFAHLLEKRR